MAVGGPDSPRRGTSREDEGPHGGAGSSLAAFAGQTPREARESLLDARQQRQRPVGFPGHPRHQALQGPLGGRGVGRRGSGRARRALPAALAQRQQRAHLLLVAERALPEALLQLPAKLPRIAPAKLFKLLPKAWVGVGDGPGGLDGFKHVPPAEPRHSHHICCHDGGASGDACKAVHQAVSPIEAATVDEVDTFFEVLFDGYLRGVSHWDAKVGYVLQQRLG